ncbi:MAG TPA: hypothetical protein VGP93_00555 [Polyangiaceae bacterium]|nr:hypothetical protein [Polyangiaceae bacterium]
MAASDSREADTAADAAFERLLLDSATSDAASDAAMREAWSRFATASGTMALVAGTGAGSGILLRAARSASAKWLLLGAIVGSTATVAWMKRVQPSVDGRSRASKSAVSAAPSSQAAPGDRPLSRSVAPASAVDAANVSPLRVAEAKRPRTQYELAREGPAIAPSAALAAEVAALDVVRAAIAAQAFYRAVRLVDDYHHDFPEGQLAPDAEVLAIEALVAQGSHAEAERRAQRFLGRYPKDLHVARIRSLSAKE